MVVYQLKYTYCLYNATIYDTLIFVSKFACYHQFLMQTCMCIGLGKITD